MAEFPHIFVILGPTASGKSALAMALARRLEGEILSVDSMQVYQGMDIGTAKPTLEERQAVRHHLIDLVTPDQTFAVGRFVELADAVIADAANRGAPLIATGGTPLYYKAVFEGLFEGPGADEAVRDRLRLLSNEELHTRLVMVDPASASRIHINDQKRLIRALEVYELTGKPISSFQTHWESFATSSPTHFDESNGSSTPGAVPPDGAAGRVARHQAKWIGLDWEREAINRRINARTKLMLADGWVDEVRRLLEEYPQLSKTASEATGYRELIEHVHGKMSLDDATEQIKISTRHLARKQMKWFRRFPGVTWIKGDQSVQMQLEEVLESAKVF